jgi:hypothetical protein
MMKNRNTGSDVHLDSVIVSLVILRHSVVGVGTVGFKAEIEVRIHLR